MATNFIMPGVNVPVTFTSGSTTGVPILVGSMPGVALDTITAGGSGELQLEGVFDLVVSAANSSATSAVAVGNVLYISAGGTYLSKDTRGTKAAKALEAITAGGTDTIWVRLIQA